LFAAADFFISAQQRGYISGIAVAALSYGLPVIQLNWGCASSIIQHGKNGFLFEKENFQKVAAQAISIRIGADSYQKMRSMALDSAKCLDLAGIAAKTIDAYLQVLAQNERSPFS
jgi:glycosyltransferase involved in cell wall biosynthesis